MSERLSAAREEPAGPPHNRETLAFRNSTLVRVFVAAVLACSEAEGQEPRPEPITQEQREKREDIEAIRQKIMTSIEKLDHKQYGIRQKAMQEIWNVYIPLMKHMNPPAPEYGEILKNIDTATLKSEQRYRLQAIQEKLEQYSKERPASIPPGTYDYQECVRLLEQQTGFRVHLDPRIKEKATKAQFSIAPGNNGCLTVIELICDQLKSTIRFTDSAEILEIIPCAHRHPQLFGGTEFIGIIGIDTELPTFAYAQTKTFPRLKKQKKE